MGSVYLRNYVKKISANIEVLVGAEYKTDCGDLIALGIDKEIISRDLDGFVSEVKSQNGIILFPHPFVSHKEIDRIAAISDLIEGFNSRASATQNNLAIQLANKHKKNIYHSPDAHTLSTLTNVIVEIERAGDLITSLQKSTIIPVSKEYTKKYLILFSTLVKSLKMRNPRLLISVIKIILIENFSIFKKV
jgi:predicted metal-dependent phosphoesterase TrpH